MLCNIKLLFAVHLTAFLYPLAYFTYTCSATALAVEFGWDCIRLSHVNSLSVLLLALSAPFFGRYGDLCGSTRALRVALLAGLFGYLIATAAVSEYMLILSRVPLLVAHTYQALQMVATHFSCREHRANAFARLGFVFRAGLLSGPYVASRLLQQYHPLLVLTLTFVCAVACFIVVQHYLPHLVIRRPLIQCCFPLRLSSVFDIRHLLKIQFDRRVFLLTFIKLLSALPAILLQTIIFQLCLIQFNLPAEAQQTLTNYISALDLLLHGIAVVVVYYIRNDAQLLAMAITLLFFSYLAIAIVSDLIQAAIACAFLACGLVFLNLAIRTQLTKVVCDVDTGAVLGLYMMKDLLSNFVPSYLQGIGVLHIGHDTHSLGRFGVLFTGIVIVLFFIYGMPKRLCN